LEVLSLASPEGEPLTITDFERAIVETTRIWKEEITPEEIEQLKQLFTVIVEMLEAEEEKKPPEEPPEEPPRRDSEEELVDPDREELEEPKEPPAEDIFEQEEPSREEEDIQEREEEMREDVLEETVRQCLTGILNTQPPFFSGGLKMKQGLKFKGFGLVILICLLFCFPASAWAADRYVDVVNGDNANDGTSATQEAPTVGPWKTLHYAIRGLRESPLNSPSTSHSPM
jgi:hypothetical protein